MKTPEELLKEIQSLKITVKKVIKNGKITYVIVLGVLVFAIFNYLHSIDKSMQALSDKIQSWDIRLNK